MMPDLPASRRRFLAAGAAALVPVAHALTAQAADGQEPVTVGVIGTGARGCDLLRSLTTIGGVKLVGLCDDYAPHLERGQRYAPGVPSCADYRMLLERYKPQAVVVAVPLDRHYRVASDALAAGCAVFCEKTMCYDLEQATRLADQVAASKRVFQVGLQRRSNPIYQQAAAMVRSGVLGQVTSIKCQWHRNNNWRRPVPLPKSDAGYAALERRLNWRLYRERSQGLMAELGSHQLDVANWLLGSTPRRVVASGGIDYWRDGRDVRDNVFCIYDYELPAQGTGGGTILTKGNTPLTPVPSPTRGEGGSQKYAVRVTYSSLCNNAFEGASELVLCTRASLLLTSNKGLLYRERTAEDVGWARAPQADDNASIITSGKTLKLSNSPWAHRGEPVEIDNLIGDDTRDELVSFIDHVRRGDVRTICDAEEGWRDTATVLMANRAMDSGAAVEFPKRT